MGTVPAMAKAQEIPYLTAVTHLKQQPPRTRALLVAATTSSILSTVTSVILIILTTEVSSSFPKLNIVTVLSLLMQLCSAAVISCLCWRERRRRCGYAGTHGKVKMQRRSDVILSLAVTGVASCLTLAAIVWVRTDLNRSIVQLGQTVVPTSSALIVFWLLSVISEAAMLFFIFPKPRSLKGINKISFSSTAPGSQVASAAPSRPTSAKETVRSVASNPFTSLHAVSPPPSTKTHSLISLQSLGLPGKRAARRRFSGSLQQSPSRTSSAPASPRLSNDSAFDTWDTSAVPADIRNSLNHNRPSSSRAGKSRLPPIPGSRPVSPAKPLDGPFPCSDEPESRKAITGEPVDIATLPPSPTFPHQTLSRFRSPSEPSLPYMPRAAILTDTRPVLNHSASLDSFAGYFSHLHIPAPELNYPDSHDLYSIDLPFPRAVFTTRVPSLSSQTSTESFKHLRSRPARIPEEQSLIHPLFRAMSPEPAPATSPGTTVTSAPLELVDLPAGVLQARVDRVRGARAASVSGSSKSNNNNQTHHATRPGSSRAPSVRGSITAAAAAVAAGVPAGRRPAAVEGLSLPASPTWSGASPLPSPMDMQV